jgi:hypothetical protein
MLFWDKTSRKPTRRENQRVLEFDYQKTTIICFHNLPNPEAGAERFNLI